MVGSCNTDVVYYVPSRTDDGSTGNNWMLDTKLVEYRIDDDGPMEDGYDDKGEMMGRMHNGQMIQSKICVGLSIDSDLSIKHS